MNTADNQKGLALAISSSIFIGSSFIVKKKGLLRARSSGHGAGFSCNPLHLNFQAMEATRTFESLYGGLAYLQVLFFSVGVIRSDLGRGCKLYSLCVFACNSCDAAGRLECYCEVRHGGFWLIDSAILASMILDEKLVLLGKVTKFLHFFVSI